MKKILFPTEFSDHAGEMFRYALELAHKFRSDLICMHAYGSPGGMSLGDEDEKQLRVEKKLREFAEKYTGDAYADVPIELVTERGYPADSILSVADRKEVDLIVLGMTGKTNDAARHLGSNSLKVIRSAHCPVLTIPASAQYGPFRKIVATTDFDFDDLHVLNFLADAFNDAEVRVVHVVEKAKEMPEARKKIAALGSAYLGRKNISFEILEGKDLEAVIESFVEKEKADLLAMNSHRRSVIELMLEGSTTRNIAKHTKTPLLVLKDV